MISVLILAYVNQLATLFKSGRQDWAAFLVGFSMNLLNLVNMSIESIDRSLLLDVLPREKTVLEMRFQRRL